MTLPVVPSVEVLVIVVVSVVVTVKIIFNFIIFHFYHPIGCLIAFLNDITCALSSGCSC